MDQYLFLNIKLGLVIFEGFKHEEDLAFYDNKIIAFLFQGFERIILSIP
jgi:hypothetical protein